MVARRILQDVASQEDVYLGKVVGDTFYTLVETAVGSNSSSSASQVREWISVAEKRGDIKRMPKLLELLLI